MNSTMLNQIIIFADGACSGNPGRGGWGAIVALPEGQIKELGGGELETTNNQMELMAVIAALQDIRSLSGDVWIYTDSVYVIRGITQWIWGWKKRGWISAEGKEVANQDLWQQLSGVVAQRREKGSIKWKFVRGHSGVPGNERVDEIAVAFSKGKRISLYQGDLLKYDVPIHDLPKDEPLPEIKPREAKPAAHSYLSLIGRTAQRHANWSECERRVKGQSGAKFKKTLSAQDELEVLKSWGIDPKTLKS